MNAFELLQRYQIHPRKSWAQHFLIDRNIQRKMIDAMGVTSRQTVVEVGPGLGILTEALLAKGCGVIAVEKDPHLCDILKKELPVHFTKFCLICGDFLQCDLGQIAGRKRVVVVGNLPYNITTPILFHLIHYRSRIREAYLTMQQEVADRLTAHPGSKDYGRLTLSVRLFADVEPLFSISRTCFLPPPQVESQFVRFTFRSRLPDGVDPEFFLKVVQAAFSKRRKQLVNVLGMLGRSFSDKEAVHHLLKSLGLKESARAEELGIGDFLKLAKVLAQKR